MVRRGPMYERGALSRQDDLKKVGINLKLTLLDTAAFRDRNEREIFRPIPPLMRSTSTIRSIIMRALRDAPTNLSRYCNPEFDKLFAEQSRTFEVQKRAEITRQMEHILLRDIPDDRGFYWKSAMGYWNRAAMATYQGTTVFNFGKFERVWCQGGKCM